MKYKRGFSLIETLVYLMILTITMTISTSVFTNTLYVYKKTINKNLEINSINEGFLSISKISREEKIVLIRVYENNIIFYKDIGYNQKLLKVLKKDKNNLIVEHYIMNENNIVTSYNSKNDIIAGINDFKAKKKGNTVYILVIKNGEKYIRCI